MKRLLVVSYSQSGQTEHAVQVFLKGLGGDDAVSVTRIDLSDCDEFRGRHPMPWAFFDFLAELPGSFFPGSRLPLAETLDFSAFDTVLVAYPVWFLHPARPVSTFLRSLPAGSLRGQAVITVCTCRNMWFGAQNVVRRLVEKKGGRVAAHATLEDRGPTAATLITTPRYFLTGKKGFDSPRWQRLLPPFGIGEADYARLGQWAGDLHRGSPGAGRGSFELNSSLALAETVGRGISRCLLLPWPLLRGGGRWLRNAYLILVAFCTFVALVTLMPPLAILGGLPFIRRRLKRRWERMVTSLTPAVTAGPQAAAARAPDCELTLP